MNNEFKRLVEFVGYGEPRQSIWFIGTEEHEFVSNNSQWEMLLEGIRPSTSICEYVHNTEQFQLAVSQGHKFDKGVPVYDSCSRVLQHVYGIDEDKAIAKLGNENNLFSNLFPIPNILESKGQAWSFIKSKCGMTLDEYRKDILSIRIGMFARLMIECKPKTIILFCDRWELLASKLLSTGSNEFVSDKMLVEKVRGSRQSLLSIIRLITVE